VRQKAEQRGDFFETILWRSRKLGSVSRNMFLLYMDVGVKIQSPEWMGDAVETITMVYKIFLSATLADRSMTHRLPARKVRA